MNSTLHFSTQSSAVLVLEGFASFCEMKNLFFIRVSIEGEEVGLIIVVI